MAEKPRNKPAGKPPADSKDSEPGRVAPDDRGNMGWQWVEDDADLLADDQVGRAERLRALDDPKLDLVDAPDPTDVPVRSNEKGLQSGYNPYNSGALSKETWKKKKDLRQLSKWIELRKKVTKGDD
jgi:hypothetical protein